MKRLLRRRSPALLLALTLGLCISILAPGSVGTARDAPPARLGKPAVTVVGLWQVNSPYYVSNRHFPHVGQSVAVRRPFRLSAIVPKMSERTTLLTPEGVILMDTPGWEETATPEELQRIEITQFQRGYRIPTLLTTQVFRHDGPIPASVDITDDSVELVAESTQRRVIRTGHPLVIRFPERPLLPAGYYLVVFRFADLPREILSMFIDGREEGLDGADQAYPWGRPYVATTPEPGVFREGLFKYSRGGETAWGEDTWCRGDIQMWMFGERAPGPRLRPEPTAGRPPGPAPDSGRCWSPDAKP